MAREASGTLVRQKDGGFYVQLTFEGGVRQAFALAQGTNQTDAEVRRHFMAEMVRGLREASLGDAVAKWFAKRAASAPTVEAFGAVCREATAARRGALPPDFDLPGAEPEVPPAVRLRELEKELRTMRREASERERELADLRRAHESLRAEHDAVLAELEWQSQPEMSVATSRLVVDMPESMHRWLKAHAALKGSSVRDVVLAMLECEMAKW